MRFRIPDENPESFPFSQFGWRRIKLLGFLLCHCSTLSGTLPLNWQSYKEGHDAADVPGYCSSRTGRRAAGYRRFIQRDARVLVHFVPHRSGASMTVETDVTAIYRQVHILNEQFVLRSYLKRNTHPYKPVDNREHFACTFHRMWQTCHRIGIHRRQVALQIAVQNTRHHLSKTKGEIACSMANWPHASIFETVSDLYGLSCATIHFVENPSLKCECIFILYEAVDVSQSLTIYIDQSIALRKTPRCRQLCMSGDRLVQKLYALRSSASDIYTFIATAFCVLNQRRIKNCSWKTSRKTKRWIFRCSWEGNITMDIQ